MRGRRRLRVRSDVELIAGFNGKVLADFPPTNRRHRSDLPIRHNNGRRRRRAELRALRFQKLAQLWIEICRSLWYCATKKKQA